MKLNVMFQEDVIFRVDLLEEDSVISSGFGEIQTLTATTDYNNLLNKPSINGVELVGDKTPEDLGVTASFPADGSVGDIFMKTSPARDGVGWVTPASSAEQDNTRPITAAAVYTEIGNINALLATI